MNTIVYVPVQSRTLCQDELDGYITHPVGFEPTPTGLEPVMLPFTPEMRDMAECSTIGFMKKTPNLMGAGVMDLLCVSLRSDGSLTVLREPERLPGGPRRSHTITLKGSREPKQRYLSYIWQEPGKPKKKSETIFYGNLNMICRRPAMIYVPGISLM